MGTRSLVRRSRVATVIAVTAAFALGAPAGAESGFHVVSGVEAPGSALSGVAALSSRDVWAVGMFAPRGPGYDDKGLEPFAEHFDGSSWHQTAIAGTRFNDDDLKSVAGASAGDAWTVGARKRTGLKSPVVPIAYHWDGAAWREVATPAIDGSRASFQSVAAISRDDVWAVGSAAHAPSTALNALAEHWDGTSWSIAAVPLPAGTSGSALEGVSAHGPSDVWAVGSASGHTLVEHFDGHAWSVIPSADVPPQRAGAAVVDSLSSVAARAANDVWAVGTAIDQVSGSYLPFRTVVEHWDGSHWSLVAAPSPYDHPELTGVTANGSGAVWAVGSGWSDVSTGVPVATPIILRFDGSAWRRVAAPANVANGDNILNGVSNAGANTVWTVGFSPHGALIETNAAHG